MSSDTITTGAGQAPEGKRNRRRFLAGVATGLAALGLGRLASGDPAMAQDGNPFILGTTNNASNPTLLDTDGTIDSTALQVSNFGGARTGPRYMRKHWPPGG